MQELERLTLWIAALAQSQELAPRLASRVDLCLTEIVTNCILHGYARTAAPPENAIIVKFALQYGQAVWCIEDHGIAFDPRGHEPAPRPTSLDDAQVGGSGLRLVRDFADRLDYQREGGTNILTITVSG